MMARQAYQSAGVTGARVVYREEAILKMESNWWVPLLSVQPEGEDEYSRMEREGLYARVREGILSGISQGLSKEKIRIIKTFPMK